MGISTLNSGNKWHYVVISLAVFMLGFAGSLYTHNPGHHHVHASDNTVFAIEHDHLQLSGDNELGIDLLLHCGADILGDIGLKEAIDSTNRDPKYDSILNTLNSYIATKDPPPPRILS